MSIVAAQVLATCWSVTLAALLVRRASRRGVSAGERVMHLAAAVLLLAWGVGFWALEDPAGMSAVNVVSHLSGALLLAIYPDGLLFPRWAAVPLGAMVVLQFGNALSGWRWDTFYPWWTLALGVIYLSLLAAQLVRFVRRSSVDARRRTAWPVLALLVQMLAFTLLSSFALAAFGDAGGEPFVALSILLNGLIGTGFAFGLLWPGLLRVDRALRAVVAFALASLTLLAVAAVLTASLPAAGATPSAVTWTTVVVVALATVPLSLVSTRLADRLVYRGRPTPLLVLDRLGAQLESGPTDEAVPDAVVRAIGEALHLDRVRLFGEGVDATWGVDGAETAGEADAADDRRVERFDVLHAGELVGTLEATPRAAEDALTEHDRLLIGHLARQSGAAIARARATADLGEARRRLVHAREEERRRLRRDLHDDLAPSFAGLGMSAAALGELVRSGDPRAPASARRLAHDLALASRQVREIAYDLRPPILDDRGLVAAIEDRTGGGSEPQIVIDAPTALPSLPAAVESAALRVVQEAVANVRRHAAASVCTVRLRVEGGMLVVVVEDDGRGFPPRRIEGIGLRSMRERTEEVGGTVAFGAADAGGVCVRVALPLEAVAP